MITDIRPLIAGNWKMNGLQAQLAEAKALAADLAQTPSGADVALCPPATLLGPMAWTLKGSAVAVGGQDCHAKASGAFTGEVSAEMLADAGAALVILGHSERRTYNGETDADVAAKVEAALRAGLKPVICVGETLEERKAEQTLAVIKSQLTGSLPLSLGDAAFAVAYEPVWAIGTGLTPTLEQIEEVHAAIRAHLTERLGGAGRKAPILYGGSVKPENAADILKLQDVGGALVGGASLKASDFLGIIRAI
jgi:triosephosphate isomerase